MRILRFDYTGTADWLKTFFFAPLDPYYTTILRVILSVAVVVVFWDTSTPLSYVRLTPWLNNLYNGLFFSKPYILAVLCLLILFYIGIRPRTSGLLLTLMLIPLVFVEGYHKSRQVMCLSIFAFSLLPSCSQFSLIKHNNVGIISLSPIWPIRLIQIQLSLLYLVNAVSKTSESYLSGEVLKGISIMMPNFLVDLSSGYVELGPFRITAFAAAAATVLIEYALAIGFWFRKTRVPIAILGVVFHLSLSHFVTIGKLDWASLFLYPAFLLPMAWKDRP